MALPLWLRGGVDWASSRGCLQGPLFPHSCSGFRTAWKLDSRRECPTRTRSKVYVPSKPPLVLCWRMFHRPKLDTSLSSETTRETNNDAGLSIGEYGALCAAEGAACHAHLRPRLDQLETEHPAPQVCHSLQGRMNLGDRFTQEPGL